MIAARTIEEVVICEKCSGRGYIESKEILNYHKNIHRILKSPCNICDGSGVLLKTSNIKFEKYNPGEIIAGT